MDNTDRLKNIVWNYVTKCLLGSMYLSLTKKLVEQITFELIKDYYIGSEKNSTSTIYEHCGGVENGEVIKRYSRYLKYADYYRHINNEFLKGFTGTDIPELLRPSMTKLKDHFKGVKLSEYQFLQLDCICEIKLLRIITDKRITSVKKISNNRIEELLDGYHDYLMNTEPLENEFHEYILWSLNHFSLESRYQVLSVYYVADKLSKYNSCKSTNHFSDSEIQEMGKLFGTIVIDSTTIAENNMLFIRLRTISQLEPGNVTVKVKQYTDLLKQKVRIKYELRKRTDVQRLLEQLTPQEIRQFIDTEYNLSELLDTKLEFRNKKEYYIRKLYDLILQDIQAAVIK